jgi:hypothetical protein
MSADHSIPEEIVDLEFHFLSPERQAEVDFVLRALQEDARLEFMLAVLEVRINDRRLTPATVPSRALLKKLLQALDEESGVMMLYTSPYNQLGEDRGTVARVEWWNLDLGDSLLPFPDLRSLRAFLECGTGTARGRSPGEATALHDMLLHALVGETRSYGIWGCSDVRTAGTAAAVGSGGPGESIWPAADVSPWFHGVFWDDLLFVLNPAESTLSALAVTSH